MKIKVFKVMAEEDKIYQELMEQYKINPEVKTLLDKPIINPELIWAGDFSLKKMLKDAINGNIYQVYFVKDIENNIFLWVIGISYDESIKMYPLLEEQSKELQLEIRRVLIEEGIFKKITKI